MKRSDVYSFNNGRLSFTIGWFIDKDIHTYTLSKSSFADSCYLLSVSTLVPWEFVCWRLIVGRRTVLCSSLPLNILKIVRTNVPS